MYSAFFQAAVGLERLMKLVVMIDHNVKHDLDNPTNEQLKRIGHDLIVLYDRCSALAGELSLTASEWFGGDSLERQFLVFLSTFAKGSRYYNLDTISGGGKNPDPVKEWVHLHQRIAETYIPYKARVKLNEEAIKHCDSLSAFGFQRWTDGQNIPAVNILLPDVGLREGQSILRLDTCSNFEAFLSASRCPLRPSAPRNEVQKKG